MAKRKLTLLDLDILFIFLVILTSSTAFTIHFIHPFVALKEMMFRIFVLLMAVVNTQRFFRIRLNLTDALVIAWFAWQVGSLGLISGFPAMVRNEQLPLIMLLYYLIIRTMHLEKNRFSLIAYAISLIALIQACIGLLQHFELFPWTSQLFQGYESQVTGTVGGANVLGALLASSLPFVYFNMNQRSNIKKGLWVVTMLMIVATLVLTKSRGAWIASIVGLGVIFLPPLIPWLKRMQRRKRALLIISISSLVIISFFFHKLYHLNVDSANGRLFIWSVTLDMIKDHLWTGVGYGQFGLHWLNYQGAYFAGDLSGVIHALAVSLTSAHSQYLQILAETGLIGLFLFGGVLFTILLTVKMKISTLENQETKIATVLTGALITLLVHGIVEDVLVGLPVEIMFFLTVSLFVSMDSSLLEEKRRLRHSQATWLQILLIPLLVFAVRSGYQEIKGEMLWKEGRDFAQAGLWEQGIDKYKQACKYLPGNPELEFYLGAAYSKIGKAGLAIKHLISSQDGFTDKNQFIALGKAYLDNCENDLAEQSLRRALCYYPELLSPHFWLSRLYFESGDLPRAREELQIILHAENPLNSREIELVKSDARRAMVGLSGIHQ